MQPSERIQERKDGVVLAEPTFNWNNRHVSLKTRIFQNERVVKTTGKIFLVLSVLSLAATGYAALAFVATPITIIHTVAALSIFTVATAISSFLCLRRKTFWQDPKYRIKRGQEAVADIQKQNLSYKQIWQNYGELIKAFAILNNIDLNELLRKDVSTLPYHEFINRHGKDVLDVLDETNKNLLKKSYLASLTVNNTLSIPFAQFDETVEFTYFNITKEEKLELLQVDVTALSYFDFKAKHGLDGIYYFLQKQESKALSIKFRHEMFQKNMGTKDILINYSADCKILGLSEQELGKHFFALEASRLINGQINYQDFRFRNDLRLLPLLDPELLESLKKLCLSLIANSPSIGLVETKKHYHEYQQLGITEEELAKAVLPSELRLLSYEKNYPTFFFRNGESCIKFVEIKDLLLLKQNFLKMPYPLIFAEEYQLHFHTLKVTLNEIEEAILADAQQLSFGNFINKHTYAPLKANLAKKGTLQKLLKDKYYLHIKNENLGTKELEHYELLGLEKNDIYTFCLLYGLEKIQKGSLTYQEFRSINDIGLLTLLSFEKYEPFKKYFLEFISQVGVTVAKTYGKDIDVFKISKEEVITNCMPYEMELLKKHQNYIQFRSRNSLETIQFLCADEGRTGLLNGAAELLKACFLKMPYKSMISNEEDQKILQIQFQTILHMVDADASTLSYSQFKEKHALDPTQKQFPFLEKTKNNLAEKFIDEYQNLKMEDIEAIYTKDQNFLGYNKKVIFGRILTIYVKAVISKSLSYEKFRIIAQKGSDKQDAVPHYFSFLESSTLAGLREPFLTFITEVSYRQNISMKQVLTCYPEYDVLKISREVVCFTILEADCHRLTNERNQYLLFQQKHGYEGLRMAVKKDHLKALLSTHFFNMPYPDQSSSKLEQDKEILQISSIDIEQNMSKQAEGLSYLQFKKVHTVAPLIRGSIYKDTLKRNLKQNLLRYFAERRFTVEELSKYNEDCILLELEIKDILHAQWSKMTPEEVFKLDRGGFYKSILSNTFSSVFWAEWFLKNTVNLRIKTMFEQYFEVFHLGVITAQSRLTPSSPSIQERLERELSEISALQHLIETHSKMFKYGLISKESDHLKELIVKFYVQNFHLIHQEPNDKEKPILDFLNSFRLIADSLKSAINSANLEIVNAKRTYENSIKAHEGTYQQAVKGAERLKDEQLLVLQKSQDFTKEEQQLKKDQEAYNTDQGKISRLLDDISRPGKERAVIQKQQDKCAQTTLEVEQQIKKLADEIARLSSKDQKDASQKQLSDLDRQIASARTTQVTGLRAALSGVSAASSLEENKRKLEEQLKATEQVIKQKSDDLDKLKSKLQELNAEKKKLSTLLAAVVDPDNLKEMKDQLQFLREKSKKALGELRAKEDALNENRMTKEAARKNIEFGFKNKLEEALKLKQELTQKADACLQYEINRVKESFQRKLSFATAYSEA